MKISQTIAFLFLASSYSLTQAAVISYTDQAIFDGLYSGLAVEDFQDITTSSQLDTNTNITTGLTLSGPYEWYVANPGQSSNATKAAGTDFYREDAINMGFSVEVHALSFELFQNNGGGSQFGYDRTALVEIYDTFSNLLGSFSLTTVSGQANFMGLFSDVAIGMVSVNDSGSYDVIDNIRFGDATGVPEPSTLALFGIGLSVVGAIRRKHI